jgi:hypothetical protein
MRLISHAHLALLFIRDIIPFSTILQHDYGVHGVHIIPALVFSGFLMRGSSYTLSERKVLQAISDLHRALK